MWTLALLDIITSRRRFIIINTLIVTLVAVLVSLLLPKEYSSITTILPPEGQTSFGGLGDLSIGHIAQAVTNFTLPIMATPSDLYASMLKSDAILKEVVDSLDLMSVYRSETPWYAVEELRDKLTVDVSPDGIITVGAVASKPELAAQIANSAVISLDRLILQMKNQKNRQYVSFLTNRLERTEIELHIALDELRTFQEKHMAISLELQSEVMINNLATLKAELTSAEVELELLRLNVHPGHPNLVRQRQRVQELQKKLTSIELGADSPADSILSVIDIPLIHIPDLSLQFSLLTRNVRIQELIYETLARQLELSRIQEQRDTPTISTLDRARPEETPIRPQKRLIVISAFILSLVASVLMVVGQTRLQELGNEKPHVVQKLRDILDSIKKRPLG